MQKELVILSTWQDAKSLKTLQNEIHAGFDKIYNFKYLIFANNKQDLEEIIVTDAVLPFSKKDFSIFNKIKNIKLKHLLQNKNTILLIDKIEYKILNKILKNTYCFTIGKAHENQYDFNLTLKNNNLVGINLYKKINKYLNQIK